MKDSHDGGTAGGQKEKECVLGFETIAWEKVKSCCSVGLRERSGWGEGEGEREERVIPWGRREGCLREEMFHCWCSGTKRTKE